MALMTIDGLRPVSQATVEMRIGAQETRNGKRCSPPIVCVESTTGAAETKSGGCQHLCPKTELYFVP